MYIMYDQPAWEDDETWQQHFFLSLKKRKKKSCLHPVVWKSHMVITIMIHIELNKIKTE